MAQPVFQAAGSAVSGVGTLTVVWPTHLAGDIALLFIETANEAVSETTSGWTSSSQAGTGTGGAAGSVRGAVYWKRATSSSEADAGVSDSGNHQIAQILTFRGCTPVGLPYDVGSGFVVTPASTSVSIAGPTGGTALSSCLIVLFVFNATDTAVSQTSGWTNANLTSLTAQADSNTASGVGGGFGVATGGWAGPGDWGTSTATLATSSKQRTGTLCLNPPAIARPPTRWTQAVKRASTF